MGKPIIEVLEKARAALGDNAMSQANGGPGITTDYYHAVDAELRHAIESLKSPPAPSTVEEIVTIKRVRMREGVYSHEVRCGDVLLHSSKNEASASAFAKHLRAALTPIVEERDRYLRLYEETKDFAEAEEVERARLAREVEELRGMLAEAQAQDYCTLCGKTLDRYEPPSREETE